MRVKNGLFIKKKLYYFVNRKNKKQKQARKLKWNYKIAGNFLVSDHEKIDKYQRSDPAFLEIPPDNHSICSSISVRGDNFQPQILKSGDTKKWVRGCGGVPPSNNFFRNPPIKTDANPPPPPHLKMKPLDLKNNPPPPFPPLKREVSFHEMIPRKSTINNNLKSS